jgi:hypothetical protein
MTVDQVTPDIDDVDTVESPSRQRPLPLNSLTAAAARLTSQNFSRFAKAKKADDRQAEARHMYHAIGELRFLANTLGTRVGQGRLYIGRMSDDPLAEPEPLRNPEDEIGEEDEPLSASDIQAWEAFAAFGNSPQQRAQMVTRAAINLFVPGDGWFVGTPPWVEDTLNPKAQPSDAGLIQGPAATQDEEGQQLDLTTLTWRFLSTAEVEFDKSSDDVTIRVEDSAKGRWKGDPDRILMFRCWRPDPFEFWMSDSPTLSALPICRQLVDLMGAMGAQLLSRIAGAGILLVPQSAEDAVKATRGAASADEGSDVSPFIEAMLEAMTTAIQEPDSVVRVAPVVFTVPDNTIEMFKHLTFSTELDKQYDVLEEKKIRRLALSLDADPEVLLGVGGLNHWGAWLVQEDTVTTHVEPPLAVICDAVTTQYIWPVLEAGEMDTEEARRYVVWYSVEHMIVRPNRFADAKDAHTANALSDEALRKYGGFDEDDAPQDYDPVVAMVLEMLRQAPSLAQTPGIPVLVEQLRAVVEGTTPPQGDQPADGDPSGASEQGPPNTAEEPAPIAASGGMTVEVDGVLINDGTYPPFAPTPDPVELHRQDLAAGRV